KYAKPIVRPSGNDGLKHLTFKMVHEGEIDKTKFLSFMKCADDMISDIITEQDDSLKDFLKTLGSQMKTFNIVKFKRDKIGNDVFIDLGDESEGTKKMFYLSGYFLTSFSNGGLMIIDELESSLHPSLFRYLIVELLKHSNAQLIFTTHNPIALDMKDLNRRDEIWFTEKDGKGKTSLYSLRHMRGVRKDRKLSTSYLTGAFGAIPNI
ncbi:MAG: ATP-binding protein, partial [Geovibrio sp.]|nr:ATP-binding protein [Geovibrio sp.]